MGRGVRPSPQTGKKDLLILDLIGQASAQTGLVSWPTLHGNPLPEEKEEGGIMQASVDSDSREDEATRKRQEEFAHEDDPDYLFGAEPELHALTDLSELEWVSPPSDSMLNPADQVWKGPIRSGSDG